MFNHDYMGHMGYMGFFPGMGIFFLIIIAIIIYLFINLFKKTNDNGENINKALDVLKSRYARGEISKEEYLSMKEILDK